MKDRTIDKLSSGVRVKGIVRRGNAMILVAGILVLLVIIATAYITRTQGGRVTAAAVQQAATRDNGAQVIAEDLANEVSQALFVSPVAASGSSTFANSNDARLVPPANAVRYGIDPQHPYNFAPYHVAPFTNWPAGVLLTHNGTEHEANPPGEPGFGDTRWLRDTEPLRWDLDRDGRYDSFRQWRHMSNIARANNGWRICTDIANVMNSLLLDLRNPVEQWQLYALPDESRFDPRTGNARWTPDFFEVWRNWFYGNLDAQGVVSATPPNFYELKDLFDENPNLPGVPLEDGERPVDEFIEGTARWDVSRVLADADGDGFTDSFWFLVPGQIERGIRQVAAVSIVDNSGLFNTNVATSFWSGGDKYARDYFGVDDGLVGRDGTAGETPADLAASGEQIYWDSGAFLAPPTSWNVGFFDNFENWEGAFDSPPVFGARELYTTGIQVEWNSRADQDSDLAYRRWKDYVTTLGFADDREGLFRSIFEDAPPGAPAAVLKTAVDRRRYWLAAASRPLDPKGGMTPFTLADEMELRLFHGQNHPWILSRFERAVNTSDSRFALLRSGLAFEETTPYLDQLRNAELLHDNRRKVTVYSGARNETMPPWLWWDLPVPDYVGGNPEAIKNWRGQSRLKVDLREETQRLFLNRDQELAPGEGLLHERLPWVILSALSDGTTSDGTTSYEDLGDTDLRKLAASFTANLMEYRDADDMAPVVQDLASTGQVGALPVPGAGALDRTRYLGMERQPFLAEAFIAHVYHAAETIPDNPGDDPDDDEPFQDEGQYYVDQASPQTTIVVVQIMTQYDPGTNPEDPDDRCFDGGIDLSQYKIRVADGYLRLSGRLCPATEDNPASAVFYSIASDFAGDSQFDERWLDFLDLRPEEMAPNTVILPAIGDLVSPWSSTRSTYDDLDDPEDSVIELLRWDEVAQQDVVIDRFDGKNDQEFGDSFREALSDEGPSFMQPPPRADSGDPEGSGNSFHNGIRLGFESGQHWVTWARVTRAFGVDLDFDALDPATFGIQPHERAPRFVFASQWTSGTDRTLGGATEYLGEEDDREYAEFYGYAFQPTMTPPDTPWFEAEHDSDEWRAITGRPDLTRKPTFFNMNTAYNTGGVALYQDFVSTYGTSFYGTVFPEDDARAGIPDKGVKEEEDSDHALIFESPLQMLQKDADFEQIGEIFYVWLYGHELELTPGTGTYITEETFSEAMSREHKRRRVSEEEEDDPFINRLRPSKVIGIGTGWWNDPMHAVPALPAGTRLLDALVCDARGQYRDFNLNGQDDDVDLWSSYGFSNAAGFQGRLTPGLININTAPVEVLRTLPHWSRLVHGSTSLYDDGGVSRSWLPRTAVAEATVAYRERIGNGQHLGLQGTFEHVYGPDALAANYAERGVDPGGSELRGGRGFASIGELGLLNLDGTSANEWQHLGETISPRAWSIGFAGSDAPFSNGGGPPTAAISTDVVGPHREFEPNFPTRRGGDLVAEDAEEANLLFAGVSNLVTTRSDVFTVYFRVRSFRQRPDGRWDATNPEYIVDDSRYVMLVDRSEVNRPSDRPKVLYLEKVPN